MSRIIEALKRWRHQYWLAFTEPDEASWLAHLALVVSGTYGPALVVWLAFGLAPALYTAKVLSELWILFMAGREVVDYVRKIAKGEPRKAVRRDGIGDLVGPVFNYGLTWLIFAVASVRFLHG